jgi:hypothetical protein
MQLDPTRSRALPTTNNLSDQGYPTPSKCPSKKTPGTELSVDQQSYNAVHGALRCLGERANSLLKTTHKILRHYHGCPWRLGDIVVVALVLLHQENNRTT